MTLQLRDWTPPPCPKCGKDEMVHKCIHVPSTVQKRKNGWYCQSCGKGPFRLGSMTEAKAAQFAITLINK